jgi:hypothetical protein
MGLFSKIKNPVDGTAQVVGCSMPPLENTQSACTMQLVVQAPGIAPFSTEQTVDLWPGKWPTAGSTLAVTFDRDHTDRLRIDWDRAPASITAVDPADLAAPAPALAPAVLAPVPGQMENSTVITMGTNQPMQIYGADSEQAKLAIAAAEQMLGRDLDGDGKVAGNPAGPGQKLDIGALMAQAQAAMASMQQGGMLPPAQSAVPPAASALAPTDTIAELERLGALRDRGALTDAEFEAQKQRILGGGG